MPSPTDIREARIRAGLTQEQAGALIGAPSRRTWQNWETGRRNMPAAKWELFQLKIAGGVMYAMTVKSNSSVSYWEDCNAKTEVGAKREAWARFGAGYVGDVVMIAIKHGDGQYQEIARRAIAAKSKWESI